MGILLVITGLFLFSGVVSAPYTESISEIREVSTLILIGGNSVVSQTGHENPSVTLVNGFRDLIYDKEVADVLSKIITCESGGNCKAQNPNSSAYGLCQMLTSTREGLEKKWGFKIDKKNCEEQYYACYRLLKEEGRKHWLETEWCWSK